MLVFLSQDSIYSIYYIFLYYVGMRINDNQRTIMNHKYLMLIMV